MKTRNMILVIILLVIFDQITKLIIYNLFMDHSFEVIPHILDFKPVFNGRYSFVNDSIYQQTGMDAGLIFHLILFALIWGILFVYYQFYKKVAPTNKMIDVAFSFFTAAAICAYIGMLFWEKGILDFMHFKVFGYIICDLKDIYINCFVVLFLIASMKIDAKYNIKLKDRIDYLKGLFKTKGD